MHEQSETIQREDGKWINVYGRNTPNAGKQLPNTEAYDSADLAVGAAKKRSDSAGRKPVRWADSSFSGEGSVVWMSPDDYLSLSPALKGEPYKDAQGKALKSSVDSGEEVNNLPSLTLKGGKVSAQDGRHRALMAKDSGIKAIPVRISGELPDAGEVIGMQGKKVKLQEAPRMWDDVVKDPEFRRLPVEEREAARRQYFDQVVAPRLSSGDVDEARKQFETDTRPRRAPRDMPMQDPNEFNPIKGMSESQKFAAGYGSVVPRVAQNVLATDRELLENFVPGGKKVSNFLNLPSRADVSESERLMKPLVEDDGRSNVGFKRKLVNAETDPSKPARMTYETQDQGRPLVSSGSAGVGAGTMALAAPTAVLPGANTVLGSGLYGTGFGALLPAESWQDQVKNALTTGGVSAGVTGAARLAPALYKAFVSPVTKGGQERMALDTIGRFSKDPNAVRNALAKPAPTGAPAVDELVPGSKASLAEVTGDPGIAQATRAAQAASPDVASEIAARHTARTQARKDALIKQFGIGSKQALEASRDAVADKLYRKAWETPIKPKDIKANAGEMKELLARPSIQRARKGALERAREEGEVLTPTDLKGGSVKGLHYIKKSLDGEISTAKRAGDADLVRLLTGTRRKLMDVVDKLSPAYKKANQEYVKASKPINQAEIGEYMYNKLFPAISDVGAERITPAQFVKVLKDGNEMAKKATGFSGAKLKDILSTDQWNTLINMSKDLGREAGALERAKAPGSPTAQYLSGRNAMRQILGPSGLPETWSEKVAADLLANRWTSAVAAPVERRVQNELALMLADPRRASAAQARLDTSRNSLPSRVANTLSRRALPPVATGIGLLKPTEE